MNISIFSVMRGSTVDACTYVPMFLAVCQNGMAFAESKTPFTNNEEEGKPFCNERWWEPLRNLPMPVNSWAG